MQVTDSLTKIWINWELKALVPVAGVLVVGVLAFAMVTLDLRADERHKVLLVATGGAAIICAATLVVLAVLIQWPLSELQAKIAQLRDGNLTVAVGFADRQDEIGELGRNFNEMVRQMRENQEEIQRLHRSQISRAEHLVTLGEVAAGLAHEVRNPLAGIAGVFEIIAAELSASSPSREVLDDARQELNNLNRFVSDLLSCARPKPPEFTPADINMTAEHAIRLARQQAGGLAGQIHFKRGKGLPLVEHDVSQINQVLLNLLLNATHEIDSGGEVRLDISHIGDEVVLSVADTGQGIVPEHLPHIFRPFFTTKGKGTGLGLSLARRVAEAHAGSIDVESTVGMGAKFTLRLPVRQPQPSADITGGELQIDRETSRR